MKRRGGVGITLEHLRPDGVVVGNSAQNSTGAISFMERFSNTTREVAQDGRRGALMISCFAPNTFIKTDKGWEYITNTIKRWNNGEAPKAWTHEGFKEITAVQELPEIEIFEIETENGKKIQVTADHKFVVRHINSNLEYLKEEVLEFNLPSDFKEHNKNLQKPIKIENETEDYCQIKSET